MKDLKLHTPSGLNDRLPEAYARKREVERRIETVFTRYGYRFVSSPMLEYVAVFEGKGSIPAAEMYKFVDRSGEMLALRPDMTPPTARIAATHPVLGLGCGPVRLCYTEKTFRNHEHFQGKADEFTQAGVELLGSCSVAADAEVIAAAVDSLLAAGLKDFRLDIGQVDFLHGVLEESGFSDSLCKTLLQHIIHRDYVAVEKMAAAHAALKPTTLGVLEILSNLTQWVGDCDMLRRVEALTRHPKALAALRHLEAVWAFLQDQGLEQYVLFDLSMTGNFDYYTGIIFKGYARGTGFTVVGGGRYDKLLSAFGKPAPAVGFGIKLDSLMDALCNQAVSFTQESAETLLMYTEAGRSVALRAADTLRRQGVIIENSLLGDDMAVNTAYAKQKNIGGIIFFADEKNIRLLDLITDTETAVTLDALLQTH